MLHYYQCTSLNKAIGKDAFNAFPLNELRSLKGERIHFQIVLWSDDPRPVKVNLKNCSDTFCKIFQVKSVPVSFAHYGDDSDSNYLTNELSMIPDCLLPLSPEDTIVVGNTPLLLWVSAHSRFAGEYTVSYEFISQTDRIKTHFSLKVLDIGILNSRCLLSAAISTHSIADNESIPPFCNVFWERLSAHFRLASASGIRDIITPLFASCESNSLNRVPDQLIRIKVNKNKYEYNYDLLDSWLLSAMQENIENFTFTAIFPSIQTQKCPYVYAEGFRNRYLLFGDENSIQSEPFISFLCDFLKKLVRHLKELKLTEHVTFIIADDADSGYSEIYNECFKKIQKILSPHKIISRSSGGDHSDFLSFPAPIVPLHAIEPYLSLPFVPRISIDPSRSDGFLNQLIAAPSIRLRSFGILGYLYDFDGFMINHYNCNISPATNKSFDPFISPEGEGIYPAGSLFMVYNHPNGPYPSIRLMELQSAIQDSVVLRLLEDYVAKERIISMIHWEIPVSLDNYPTSEKKFHQFREKIYDLYERNLNSKK